MTDRATRTTWPAAAELQRAADTLRARPGQFNDALADWCDATANALAWLAPYREHEPGYAMWAAASRVADLVNAQPEPAPTPAGCWFTAPQGKPEQNNVRACALGPGDAATDRTPTQTPTE